MPLTAILFLIGSISISAIPPFNGFASEYQIYLSMLAVSAQRISGFWIIGGILGCTALALTGALAAACFVKAFGVSFLALPRSSHALKAKEVPLNMTLSIAPLALFCLVLGAIPGKIMSVLTRIALQLTGDVGTINVQTFDYKIFVMVILVMIVVTILIKIRAPLQKESRRHGAAALR
jgi:hydrogenase-4 component B